MKKLALTAVSTCLIGFVPIHFAGTNLPVENSYKSCWEFPEKQKARSKELQDLEDADQKARDNYMQLTWEQRAQIAVDDNQRRQRVGEIFGEGCFKNPKDYQAAALIFQHGDTADHFYQSFVWFNKAALLGDKNALQGVALAIDRYLVHTGHKQLFGTQAKQLPDQKCLCIEQTEASVPDSMIKKYSGMSLKERAEMYTQAFHQDNSCVLTECSNKLKPTPKGSIPGFW